ncbi:sporulation protein YtfJ [Anoxybacillus sp. B7M1]|jgi:sporulation protein YtfJ|uniref:GerW family sporulation protein n=1 Tax=Anoxybacteroides rupiense TaxID=311460 RepID=A0ABD5ITF9_9BACL|nr:MULTISPECIES: GerW family sporulation protein [Anoxybacillus]ANB55655.1 sporulation protein YtfJ [Anoxybacillus sp. B2M1]ANB65735.1 sporulation protein YtfJ [Anoxybacillus sp. B7M1]KXG11619.1 putative spore protein YtfJ [Anoxybacillus sp. P3H1B]MBB3907050.1 sporulation protein YtfJ [Anoxybacillus rupiensis]MBS2771422.1 GerW family sporulation protein [Anoxybacillus rupiensis]
MSNHPIQGLMTTAMENLKQMIDVNTIIGDPVETPDGSVILTVSKVGFGFAAGGSEFMLEGKQNGTNTAVSSANGKPNEEHPFGGGSGGGVSITPIAFLVVNSSGVKLLHLDENTHLYEKILDFAPQVIEKIQHMLRRNKEEEERHEVRKNDLGI